MVQQLGQVTPECTFLAAEELAFAEEFTDVLFYCLFIKLFFLGLLLFSTMLILLVAGCVSHCTFHVLIHLDRDQHDWCGKSLNFNGMVDWYSSLEDDPAAQIVGLPNIRRTRLPFEMAEKHVRIFVGRVEAFKSLNTQDKGERVCESRCVSGCRQRPAHCLYQILQVSSLKAPVNDGYFRYRAVSSCL